MLFGEERRGEGEGWKHKCSARRISTLLLSYIPSSTTPPPPPPTYSPSSLNLWDDEIGVQELGERHGRRQLTGTILWV